MENASQQRDRQLSVLFILHAGGLSTRTMFCFRCNKNTIHGKKLGAESFYHCLEHLKDHDSEYPSDLPK